VLKHLPLDFIQFGKGEALFFAECIEQTTVSFGLREWRRGLILHVECYFRLCNISYNNQFARETDSLPGQPKCTAALDKEHCSRPEKLAVVSNAKHRSQLNTWPAWRQVRRRSAG